MSAFLAATPDLIDAAATDVGSIGSALSEAQAAATTQTVALVPAAADEVSAATAKLFGGYAHEFQAVSAQALALHEQFVQHLKAGGDSYAGAEAANAASLHARADPSARSIAASKTLPPESQKGRRLGDNALWLFGQIVYVDELLGKLPLPAPFITGLQKIWFLATLPIVAACVFIILVEAGL